MKFNAWWEESIDGFSNYASLVVALANDDDDEQHPLIGVWPSKEAVIAAAREIGVLESDINFQ